MALFLILIFIVLPIAELYVIIKVGGAIGVLPTIALLIADSFLGAALLRSQGRAAWRRFNEALAAGRVPAREVFDGTMIILGGAFLLTPGFITDVIGLLLLIPPTRAIFRGLVARMALRRAAFTVRTVRGATAPPATAPTGTAGPATTTTRAALARSPTRAASSPRTRTMPSGDPLVLELGPAGGPALRVEWDVEALRELSGAAARPGAAEARPTWRLERGPGLGAAPAPCG